MSAAHAEIRVRRRIEWVDTDAAGIYHWTTAFRLVEAAETELFDRLGMAEGVYGVLPRAHVRVDYRRPLRFNDQVDVRLWVTTIGERSIRYGFELHRGPELVADGELVVVHIDPETGTASRLPTALRSALTNSGS